MRLEQMSESFEHVCIAQIPRFCTAIVHDPIVALGGGDQACVLRGVKKAFTILIDILEPALKQLPTLIDYRLFALAVACGEHSPSVSGGLFLPRREAAIALARHGGGLGIDLTEIFENSGD